MDSNFQEKRAALNYLSEKLLLTPVGIDKEWGSANVVITSHQDKRASRSFYSQLRQIVTADAKELSWLFCKLGDIFLGLYDSTSELEFFGRLANTALRYQSLSKNDENQRDLLFAVLHEAFAILDEMESGIFEYFLVSPGNEIVDDFIEQAQRRGFVSVEETKKFFALKGIKL
ncbi:hypothetical protein [Chlorogloea sp. CCALA 695]|uniref:hypothetical protein n=1 Tax=Chlorogloea sp. CCALA 695 TaxID=2107693 RepID=UPI000D058BDF|nr:hypothetical protein [Chlorogloea sp. CCALA 695]PSB26070.1 hypothetical protein C7B70_24345 [Chlorogloea sp. CCALA 695]